MKVCSQCKMELALHFFDVQATGKQGRRADCKDCRKRFTRSKEGLVKSLFTQQKAKAIKRGYAPPDYTEAELLAWAIASKQFHTLYWDWVGSNYNTKLRPSFDRLNDYISYSLSNLQVMTWAENSAKGHIDKVAGRNTKDSLAVDMLCLAGVFIQRFHSVSAAARHVGGVPTNIIGAINNRVSKRGDRSYTTVTAYGHKWRYSSVPNNNGEIPQCKN